MKRKTAKDRLMRAVRAVGDWCRQGRHLPVATQRAALSRKLLGHYAYYGITGNHRALVRFYVMARRAWWRWLYRRSPRNRPRPRGRAPPGVRLLRSARTSRSALGFVPGRDADEDVRAPPGVRLLRGARTSRSALGFVQAGMRTRTSVHHPGFGFCEVRGPPGPHWASCQAGMRTRTSAHHPGFRLLRSARTSRSALGFVPGRNADGDVRAPSEFAGVFGSAA